MEQSKIIYLDRRRRQRESRQRCQKLASLSKTIEDFALRMQAELSPFLGDVRDLPHGRDFLEACEAFSTELEAQSKIIWLRTPQL